jgi:hypothetical protein
MNDTQTVIDPKALPALTIEEFRALSPEAKRVAIVRDALSQLTAERFIAYRNYYFVTSAFSPEEVNRELRDLILSRPDCEVCALGACFVSAVRLGDALALTHDYYQRVGRMAGKSYIHFSENGFDQKLMSFFNPEQLDLMEAAFECSFEHARCLPNRYEGEDPRHDPHDDDDVDSRLIDAVNFGERFLDDDERLVAILRNMESNDGEFIPY